MLCVWRKICVCILYTGSVGHGEEEGGVRRGGEVVDVVWRNSCSCGSSR